jgi:hypothetical protein
MDSNKQKFFALFDNQESLKIDKELARIIDLKSALFYAALINKYNKCVKNNEFYNGYFSYTFNEALEDTSFSIRVQQRLVRVLISHGLIAEKITKFPAKRHFKIIKFWNDDKKEQSDG